MSARVCSLQARDLGQSWTVLQGALLDLTADVGSDEVDGDCIGCTGDDLGEPQWASVSGWPFKV